MKAHIRISIGISTAYALLASLMAWSFDMPVIVCASVVWFGSFALCWMVLGLCNVASETEEAIDRASKEFE